MMAAAQAAAEAALREARERSSAEAASTNTQESAEPSEAAVAALLQQHAASMEAGTSALPQHLVEENMMQLVGDDMMESEEDSSHVEELLRLMAQQEQHEQELVAAAAIAMRPREHHLTIAQNGMILGATDTVTGLSPDSLLMTSSYDTVYDEDLPGLLAVKSHFWDNGHLEVPAYIRRQTLEGEWIWLATTVLSFIEEPVPGVVLLEKRISDESNAALISRMTRIAAILVQAVGAGQVALQEGSIDESTAPSTADSSDEVPTMAMDDVTSYQTWLQQEAGKAGALETEQLQRVMEASSARANKKARIEPSKAEAESTGNESFDPLAVLKSVRSGIRLDLGMIRLSTAEAKMVVLVLTGRIQPEELGAIIFSSLNTPGSNLNDILDRFMPLKQMQPAQAPSPAYISVVNLSYTYLGNDAMELLSEILYVENLPLQTIDVSFCGLDERGILAFARGINERKRKGIPSLEGVIMSGNCISYRAAKELGTALSLSVTKQRRRKRSTTRAPTGYDEDSESLGDDDEDEMEPQMAFSPSASQGRGLQILHIASSSLTPEALYELLVGLGSDCPIRELSIHSNAIGPSGATLLVDFLEGKGAPKNVTVMPKLDRLDISNNGLRNEGTSKLTRAISKRSKVQLVELRLSLNDIGAGGVETMMNKLLQHNLISLSLDKNAIGDQGCQLVAASLPSMQQLARLNLSFNQIGSRGINTLMRSVVGSESITYLGLSGNIMKISGAIAMGFMLAQHPRLEELDLYNCCLSQAAQCHIVAGVISNRWVPMKRMTGFEAGPPMVAIGALEPFAHQLSNEECFRLRRDEQMKTILQWTESNRASKLQGGNGIEAELPTSQEQYLTPEFVSNVNEVQGTPSQNAYLRMLGWLSRIPFDEDELTSLRGYFYDLDGGEGDRGSDGYINLKLRGDLLAALDSDVADEIRDAIPVSDGGFKGTVGLDLDLLDRSNTASGWPTIRGLYGDRMPEDNVSADGLKTGRARASSCMSAEAPILPSRSIPEFDVDMVKASKKRRIHSSGLLKIHEVHRYDEEKAQHEPARQTLIGSMSSKSSLSKQGIQSLSKQSMHSLSSKHSIQSDASDSNMSQSEQKRRLQPRITMFPAFEAKLEELKDAAKEMIEYEDDPDQQDIILTQYAEASLTILRQLRYHCMNSGLDGWRQGGLRRKVLVVDDSKVTRKLVSRAFQKANFIVDTAENGVEGVAKLKESIYDITFMDIDMPVMNGFEATKELREWEDIMRPGARQPICALTAAYVDDFEKTELMKFKEAGLDVMESKPCNIPRLFKVVDDVSPMFSDLSISMTKREVSM